MTPALRANSAGVISDLPSTFEIMANRPSTTVDLFAAVFLGATSFGVFRGSGGVGTRVLLLADPEVWEPSAVRLELIELSPLMERP